MEQRFVGFDPLPLHENGFELRKDGNVFLSLYHDLSLKGFDYKDDEFVMHFVKRSDAARMDTIDVDDWSLTINGARIQLIESRGEGNFEDLEELEFRGEDRGRIELMVVIGAATFVLTGDCLVLKEHPKGFSLDASPEE